MRSDHAQKFRFQGDFHDNRTTGKKQSKSKSLPANPGDLACMLTTDFQFALVSALHITNRTCLSHPQKGEAKNPYGQTPAQHSFGPSHAELTCPANGLQLQNRPHVTSL